MKLTVLNELSDEIMKQAKLLDDNANLYARMFAESDKKEYQVTFRTKTECAAAIREVHKLSCQMFHYLESVMSKEEIDRLNKIEYGKGK